mmetsp:Transcript_26641/g.57766  ORF Transcript_26641/g.57766 Transcript_26641/m.57766 type:complete len:124 (+) Transcript_26641:162-533(+)
MGVCPCPSGVTTTEDGLCDMVYASNSHTSHSLHHQAPPHPPGVRPVSHQPTPLNRPLGGHGSYSFTDVCLTLLVVLVPSAGALMYIRRRNSPIYQQVPGGVTLGFGSREPTVGCVADWPHDDI